MAVPAPQIQRFLFRAHPAKNHPTYFEWQVANVCVFIRGDDPDLAFRAASEKLRREHWQILSFGGGSTLIEERIREQAGVVLEAYGEAARTGSYIGAFVDGIMGSKQNPMLPRVPRITETFIDHVIGRAGGRRLTAAERNNQLTLNADYIFDDRVLELKILKEEGLEKETRQAKLAELFRTPIGPYTTVELNPAVLTEQNRLRYNDIVGGPIQTAIRSASSQIVSTKTHLAQPDLRGGIIIVNTGYGTLHPDLLLPLTKRYATKYRDEVQDVVAISSWLVPGKVFDATMYFQCEPKDSPDATLQRIYGAFWECVEEFMTDYMRAGMNLPGAKIDPVRPITFEKYGIVFAAVPAAFRADEKVHETLSGHENTPQKQGF